MGKFKNVAEDSLVLSKLHKGRDQMTTQEAASCDSLTVAEFDIAVGENMRYGVMVFEEYPDKYYNTGLVGTKLIDSWAHMYGDDVIEANAAYAREVKADHGNAVRLAFTEEKCKTDKSKNVTTIKVVE